MEHQPIDYSEWDFSGLGKNITHLLSETEKKIWNTALPHQDKRDDPGHAENVTYFALKLLEHMDADRSIVIPAAILHDIGWSQMSKIELDLFFDPNWKRYEPVSRARHQEMGVHLAGLILNEIKYPAVQTYQILDIISLHDTRERFLSREDGVMRDSDKLWRYTVPVFDIATKLRKVPPTKFYSDAVKDIQKPGFFYSEAAKEMARIELEATKGYVEKEI